jgi:hypothetical protein
MSHVRPSLSALAIVVLGSCNGDPYSTCYTTREPVHQHQYFHFRNEKPPYLIHVTLGDPDSGEAHVFERS